MRRRTAYPPSRPSRSSACLTISLLFGCYASGDPIDGSTGDISSGEAGVGAGPAGGDDLVDDTGTPDPPTYWISETTNFQQSGLASCVNTNLNQVGLFLQLALDADGWNGTYALNGQTDLDDFLEASAFAFGQDDIAADNAILTVYAGHGATSANGIQWGNPSPNAGCNLSPMSQVMQLGGLAGDTSRFLALVTSCTAFVPKLKTTLLMNGVGQLVGWHNSPAVDDKVLSQFYNTTAFSVDGNPISNRLAWMSGGQSKPGLGWNSPVIYTFNDSWGEIQERHQTARIALGIGISDEISQNTYDPNDLPPSKLTWIDNGDGPCF